MKVKVLSIREEEVATKWRDTTTSFRVCIPYENKEALLNQDRLPMYVGVREWTFKKKKQGTGVGESNRQPTEGGAMGTSRAGLNGAREEGQSGALVMLQGISSGGVRLGDSLRSPTTERTNDCAAESLSGPSNTVSAGSSSAPSASAPASTDLRAQVIQAEHHDQGHLDEVEYPPMPRPTDNSALPNDEVARPQCSQTTAAAPTLPPTAPFSAKRKASPTEGTERNRARLTEPGGPGASSEGDSEGEMVSKEGCDSESGTNGKQQLSWAEQGNDVT